MSDSQPTWEIIGIYRGTPEVLDTTDSRKEAYDLRREYEMAFGNEWEINIKKIRS